MLYPTDYLILVEAAINNRHPHGKNSYHICHFNGSIACMPRKHTPIGHHVFGNISKANLRHGFTEKEWQRLSGKIYNFYKGKYPCEIDQKA